MIATHSPNPNLQLFIRNLHAESSEKTEEIKERRDAVIKRMEQLEANGKIADCDVFNKAWDRMIGSGHRDNRGGGMKFAVDKYDEFNRWATRNHLSIRPHFNQVDTLGGMIRFPDLCLAAYEGSNVRGVFPCSDETTVYSIEDYLDAMKAGEDWRDWKQANPSITPDWGLHGDIKLNLIYNTNETVGEEWEFVVDEYSVQSGSYQEEWGRIDLVFQHTSQERYLLVEVKPDKDEVDTAFGQALRYRYQFLGDRTIPDLGPSDIELGIAAPKFYESHQKAADEVGIRLIPV